MERGRRVAHHLLSFSDLTMVVQQQAGQAERCVDT